MTTTTAMNESCEAFERLDTKLTIVTWIVDLVVTLGVLRLLPHG